MNAKGCKMGWTVKNSAIGVGLMLSTTLLSGQAWADGVSPANIAVADRVPPGYEPNTIHLGAFLIDPSVTVQPAYDDNYLALPSNPKGVSFVTLASDMTVRTSWARNALNLHAGVTQTLYSGNSTEGSTAGHLNADFRLDIDHTASVDVGVNAAHVVLPRTAVNSAFGLKNPEQYSSYGANISSQKTIDRVGLYVGFSVDDYYYLNDTLNNGLPIYLKDQDRVASSITARASYDYSLETNLFVQLVTNDRSYRNRLPGEATRDSNGYNLTVGSRFRLSRLIEGNVSIGYLEQNYDSKVFRTVSGVSIQGQANYYVTQLTTINASASRSVEDSAIPNVSGYLVTTMRVAVDHELRRNVIISGSLQYENVDFGTYSRIIDRWSEYAGLRYLVSRAVSLTAGVSHIDQSSSGKNRYIAFDENKIFSSLTYRF